MHTSTGQEEKREDSMSKNSKNAGIVNGLREMKSPKCKTKFPINFNSGARRSRKILEDRSGGTNERDSDTRWDNPNPHPHTIPTGCGPTAPFEVPLTKLSHHVARGYEGMLLGDHNVG